MNNKKPLFISGGILLFCLILITFWPRSKNVVIKWEPVSVSSEIQKPILNVYIENSGSMNAYMCDGSELKDAVYSYVTSLGSYCDTTNLFYINTQVIPYKDNAKSFIRDLNATAFAKAGGNTANTDISDMFEKILKGMDKNSVSIFVSDCILDIPNGDAKDFLVNRQIDIRNAFTAALVDNPNLGVEIFRMESKVNGYYYYTQGKELLSDEIRPYFMYVIGNKDNLVYLNNNVPFKEIKHGFKNYFAYANLTQVPFEFTNNYFKKDKTSKCSSKPYDGVVKFYAKLNLNGTLQDNSYLSKVGNYEVSGAEVIEIQSLADNPDGFTHQVEFEFPDNIKPCQAYLILKAENTPAWLEQVNDEEGNDVHKNMDKTTGVKYIIGGISDAFSKVKELVNLNFIIGNR